jgi:hypothetical protein
MVPEEVLEQGRRPMEQWKDCLLMMVASMQNGQSWNHKAVVEGGSVAERCL